MRLFLWDNFTPPKVSVSSTSCAYSASVLLLLLLLMPSCPTCAARGGRRRRGGCWASAAPSSPRSWSLSGRRRRLEGGLIINQERIPKLPYSRTLWSFLSPIVSRSIFNSSPPLPLPPPSPSPLFYDPYPSYFCTFPNFPPSLHGKGTIRGLERTPSWSGKSRPALLSRQRFLRISQAPFLRPKPDAAAGGGGGRE